MLAVNHVISEQERNVKRAFLHREMLITICRVGAHHVEKRPDLAPLDHRVVIERIALGSRPFSARVLGQLPDLLLKRHRREQFLHPRVKGFVRQLRVRRLFRHRKRQVLIQSRG